jgi:hypothetical protein
MEYSELIEQTARICHETNRAYCATIGDDSQVPWEQAPEWQKDSARAGVMNCFSHEVMPSDSHANWLKQKESEGWVYGEVKDAEKKTHPCMRPYRDLPVEQKTKDYLFVAICKVMSKFK